MTGKSTKIEMNAMFLQNTVLSSLQNKHTEEIM